MNNIKKDKFYKIKFLKIDIIKILLLTICYFKKWGKELLRLDKKEAFPMRWKKVKLDTKEVCQMQMILLIIQINNKTIMINNIKVKIKNYNKKVLKIYKIKFKKFKINKIQ